MAMKSPALIQKESAYPPEFEKAVTAIKTTRDYTVPVIQALEKIVRPPQAHRKEELERMSLIAQKYTPHLSSGAYFEALKATGNACAAVNKREQETLSDSFDRVFAPMKSWVEEDYPRLMKEIKKCYAVKEEMDRAVMATGARQTPERSAKCEAAKKRHKEFFDRVSTEVFKWKAVHRHHMQCLRVLMYKRYLFEKSSKLDFESAYTRCSTEIEAGITALQTKPSSESN
uniref:BAR domain-containing protein n=1 Tax=Ascaris lumbricoides TaxID=6252 RepID=A0A0M3HV17_ASCLU